VGGAAGEQALQLLAVGTIAHQGQACLGHGIEHRSDALDLLLGREAADIEQQLAAVAAAGQ